MHIDVLPLVFALIGLALYTVLGGADFGAGLWQLLAVRGRAGEEIRDHAHHAMAPVWEANHVWLIFVLTVIWTAYPSAFASIASTLSIPLFVAGIGVVLRGGAYALRAGSTPGREQRALDAVFALSSLLTPFALGTVIGGIASERVHVGNPGGSLVTSWLNPTSIDIGLLAVASAAYSAAVFLAGDAARTGDTLLAERFRLRALAAGLAAGAVAIAGLAVLHADAGRIFERLTHGDGLSALLASLLAGIATLILVWRRRYEPARYTAAAAIASTVAGWALAQSPIFLRGLTVQQAAAPHDTQVAVVLAVIGGGIILLPSLALLFRLTLGGRLGEEESAITGEVTSPRRPSSSGSLGARIAGAAFIAGVGFLTAANAAWAHAIGATSLLLFVLAGYRAALPADVERPYVRTANNNPR
jgi:cytochrome bd ubiquinol oxidase subunit II